MVSDDLPDDRIRRPSAQRPPVFVLEPLALVCDCLRAALEVNGCNVVGWAHSGGQAVPRLADLKPRVILCEIEFPDGSGPVTFRALVQRFPTAVVVMSGRDDEATVNATKAAGAAAFVSKRSGLARLLATIEAVAGGTRGLEGEEQKLPGGEVDQQMAALRHLSPREKEISKRVGKGLTNKEVAHELNLTPITVRNHLSNVMRKVGVRSRTELAKVVALAGWLWESP